MKNIKEICEKCEGTGMFAKECGRCNKEGLETSISAGRLVPCLDCRGTKKEPKTQCERCDGKGHITLNDLLRLEEQAERAHKEALEKLKEPRCGACDDTGRVTEYSAEGPEGSYPCSCSAGSQYR